MSKNVKEKIIPIDSHTQESFNARVLPLYLARRSGVDNSIELFDLLSHIVNIVAPRSFPSVSEFDADDLKSRGREYLWKKIKNNDLPDIESGFFNYFYECIKNEMLRELKGINQQIFESGNASVECPSMSKLYTVDNVENYITAYEVLQNLYMEIVAEIRFGDNEFLLCKYILSRILISEVISPRHIKRAYGIQNYKFYVDYIQVKIKSKLYKYRDILTKMGCNIAEISQQYLLEPENNADL